MKKQTLNYLIIAAIAVSAAFTSCKKDDDDPYITMTTNVTAFEFYLAGTGGVTINWGDGSPIEKHTLDGSSESEYILYQYAHTYSTTNPRVVTITGKNITYLHCSELASLNVSNCAKLVKLNVINSQLTSFDVSKNTKLTELRCYNSQLTSLDVSKNVMLKRLNCSNNQLTSLNVSNCYALGHLYCMNNNLTEAALNNLFNTLPINELPSRYIWISGNPGTDSCNRSIAENKGWHFNFF